MISKKTCERLASFFLAMVLPMTLFADNGIYPIGFGAKSRGMGGVAVAYTQDTLSALVNPAGLADLDDRVDAAVGWGYHTQKVAITNIPPLFGELTGIIPQTWPMNGSRNIYWGEFGISKRLNDSLTASLVVSPQAGGINKVQDPHPANPPNQVAGSHFTRNKEKVFYAAVTPMLSYRPQCFCNHSFGIGIDFTGAAVNFSNFKSLAPFVTSFETLLNTTLYPHHISDKGWDYAWGVAGRFGWLWHIKPCISVGISYRTKTFMSRFHRYEGLITPQGRADLPAILTAGLSWQIIPSTTIAFDYSRIYFHDVPAFGNKVAQQFITIESLFPPQVINNVLNPHGANNGAAFGWKSTNVYKVGISHQLWDCLTLRAGYDHGETPIPKIGTLESAFIPVVVENYLALGATWNFCSCAELSLAYVHGYKKKFKGHPAPFSPPEVEALVQYSSQVATITARLDQVELQLSWLY